MSLYEVTVSVAMENEMLMVMRRRRGTTMSMVNGRDIKGHLQLPAIVH